MHSAQRSSGQILLIVLLGVTGALFVVLSVTSRSVNDLSQTSLSQSSSQAFSAAEAGIEKALSGSVGVGVTVGNSTYTSTKVPLSAASKAYNYPVPLSSGEMAYLWLVSRDENGNMIQSIDNFRSGTLKLCWGNVGVTGDETPAVEFELYYDVPETNGHLLGVLPQTTYAGIGVKRIHFDPHPTRIDYFVKSGISTSCVIDGVSYAYGRTIDLRTEMGMSVPCTVNSGCMILATAKILYSSQKQPVGFFSANTADTAEFPSQGYAMESTGTSGGSVRKVQLVQTFDNPDSIFTNGIYAVDNVY